MSAISLFRSMSARLRAATGMWPGRSSDIGTSCSIAPELVTVLTNHPFPSRFGHLNGVNVLQAKSQLADLSGGGRGIRTPKGLAARGPWGANGHREKQFRLLLGRLFSDCARS